MPEKGGPPIFNLRRGKTFEEVQKLESVPPPERAFLNMAGKFAISVIFLPNKVDPRDVLPIEEFMQAFGEKGPILLFKIKDPKASFILWNTY